MYIYVYICGGWTPKHLPGWVFSGFPQPLMVMSVMSPFLPGRH